MKYVTGISVQNLSLDELDNENLRVISKFEIDNLDLRTLQKESARVISTMNATSNNIYQFNKKGHHNSMNWYKAVLKWYMEKYDGLPSEVGPGKNITFIIEN